MPKILVTGFPHSGTTIVRKILGNAEELEDIPYETGEPFTRDAVVYKYPIFNKLNPDWYPDHKFILVIRDPRDTFASIALRYPEGPPYWGEHNLRDWFRYAEKWKTITRGDIYKIRYEDLFDEGHASLKKLFDWLGLKWKDEYIDTSRKTPMHTSDIPTKRPERTDHDAFRSWQIHQPFENYNKRNRDHLPEKIREEIETSELVRELGYF